MTLELIAGLFGLGLLANGVASALSFKKDWERQQTMSRLLIASEQAKEAANNLARLALANSPEPLIDLLKAASSDELREIETAIANIEAAAKFLRETKDANLTLAFTGTGLAARSVNNKATNNSSSNNNSNNKSGGNETQLEKFANKRGLSLAEAKSALAANNISESEFENDGKKRGEFFQKFNAAGK